MAVYGTAVSGMSGPMSAHLDEGGVDAGGGGLRGYLDVVLRRKWIVLAVTVAAVAVAAGASYVQSSVYRAQSKIVIGQGQSLFQVPNGASIQPFTATMSDLLESNVVAGDVIRSLRLDLTPEQLLARLSASINPETAVITAHYDDTDATQARRILRQTGVVFARLVRERFGQVQGGTAASPPITATVFDPAHVLPGRVSPSPIRNMVLAGALGLLLGLLAAFLREHFDRALRSREAVEGALGAPVIGQLPFARAKGVREVAWSGTGEIAEAYRGLRANLQYLAVRRPLRTMLVTSASPQQGKTTVTANLGVAIARSGASTIVIEADLRRPRLDTALDAASAGPGLTSVLVGAAQPADAIREVDLRVTAERDRSGRLAFMPSGPLPPNPSELLSSPAMQDLLARLAASFDYVLIDSPPLLLVADALELARNVDGVVLAVRRSQATTDEAREVRALTERLGINLVGAAFTDVAATGAYGTYGDAAAKEPEQRRQPVAAPRPQDAVVDEL